MPGLSSTLWLPLSQAVRQSVPRSQGTTPRPVLAALQEVPLGLAFEWVDAMSLIGHSREPSWTCEHCGVDVYLPDKVSDPLLHAQGLIWIRNHRFGHLVDILENASDEELLELASGPDPTAEPITSEDAGPAVVEAERIVRGGK